MHGVTSYGSGRRKDVIKQCLEFGPQVLVVYDCLSYVRMCLCVWACSLLDSGVGVGWVGGQFWSGLFEDNLNWLLF